MYKIKQIKADFFKDDKMRHLTCRAPKITYIEPMFFGLLKRKVIISLQVYGQITTFVSMYNLGALTQAIAYNYVVIDKNRNLVISDNVTKQSELYRGLRKLLNNIYQII